ncbi:MAG TPA: hypothetical protein VN890_03555 [Methylocella sp.]|nr:hypothetical protein [Methylocella sp.]
MCLRQPAEALLARREGANLIMGHRGTCDEELVADARARTYAAIDVIDWRADFTVAISAGGLLRVIRSNEPDHAG